MSQRSSDLETVKIILHILQNMPKNRKTSIAEIKKNLEQIDIHRSARTLQRLMNETICSEFDVELDDREKPYGYSWKSHSNGLNLPVLNEQQSLLLLLAKQHLQSLLPASVSEHLQPFFEQAHRQLQKESGQNAKQWLNKVALVPTSQPLIPPKIHAGIYETVSYALYHNQKLSIHYRNQSGVSFNYTVKPLALVQQGNVLYLVVQFDGYDNFRHLALHRIVEVRLKNQTFETPKDFNFADYLQSGSFAYGSAKPIILQFSISKQAGFHITETPLSEDQIILEETDDYYRFQATALDTDMLDWWLRKFGDEIWDIVKMPSEN